MIPAMKRPPGWVVAASLVGAVLAGAAAILLSDGPDSIRTQRADLDPAAFPEPLRTAADQIAAIHRQRPGDPSVLYQVAALHARAGHAEEAIAALKRMADLGSGVDPRLRDGFQSLAGHSEFLRIRERIQREHPPVHRARLVFDINEGDLAPEGIAFSERSGLLYLGSVRKIFAVSRDGEVRLFVGAGANGLGAVAGIRVDDRRGELWATSGALGASEPSVVAGLLRFRLSDGERVAAHPIPSAEPGRLNDVAVTPAGVAYATATVSRSPARYRPSRQPLATLAGCFRTSVARVRRSTRMIPYHPATNR